MQTRRRIDRITDPDYLGDLTTRSTDDIRTMRDECEEEESGISYARRVLQGKLDILRAEALRRRDEGNGQEVRSLLDALPTILSDDAASRAPRVRVTRFLVPPGVQHHRRAVERIADDQTLANLAQRPPGDLTALVQRIADKERELSALRRELLDRIDALQEELARRYRGGTANVAEVLQRRG